MKKRFASVMVGLLGTGVVVGLAAAPAAAAPTGAKNAFAGIADCGAAGTFQLVVNNANGQGQGAQTNGQSQAEWAPAHLSSGQVFHPTAFEDLTFTFTPVSGPSESFTNNDARKNQVGNVSCHISGSQTDGLGNTFSVDGGVVGVVTPS
jgi:hypothetical protein